ncbi:unnamed protein product [Schistosoma turkestanicum]|nr:unnamed protein product [Schistosoma turkestanicum]
MTYVIYPNGNISIFYENIPAIYLQIELEHTLFTSFNCEEFCSGQRSPQSCKAASEGGVKCHWCPTAEQCSNRHDVYTAIWKENNCDKILDEEERKNIVVTEKNEVKQKEITANTSGSNMELHPRSGSRRYTYVGVLLVVSLLILVKTCVTIILIYKRKSNIISPCGKIYH